MSVIVGEVVEKSREETVPDLGPVSKAVCYAYWRVEVERYLVEPQPYPEVTLRFIDRFIRRDGSPIPPRFPVSLTPGERAVFFLTALSGTAHPSLEGDAFTVFLAPAGGGIREIKDEQVRTVRDGQGQWEPLGDFISRIMRVAREAGRTVGELEQSLQ